MRCCSPRSPLPRARFDEPEMALVEIGPSAGLNLLFDRYHASYSDGRTSGSPESPVQLTCEIVGDTAPPLPASDLRIVSREGIDLAPVDLDDDDGIAWLEACIWPDVPGRLDRFEAAVRIARTEPPVMRRGDAARPARPGPRCDRRTRRAGRLLDVGVGLPRQAGATPGPRALGRRAARTATSRC